MTQARRRVAVVILTIVTIVVVVAALSIKWIRFPSSTTVDPEIGVDAVVVLAGGDGERLQTGLDLMESGVAPMLIVSTGNSTWQGRAEVDALCAQPQPFTVLCREVSPDNTLGEAADLSRLAQSENLNSIALVTSTYHLHRATTLFRRCYDGAILPVKAAATPTRDNAAHEWFGIIQTIVSRDDCRSAADD